MSLHKVLPPHMVAALKNDKARFYLDRKGTSNPRYDAFREQYFNNRVGFIRDCIRWPEGTKPYSYQLDIAGMFDAGAQRVAARGGRGLGKTGISALLVLHYALTRADKDWKIPTTASVWRQLIKFLWPEIHKWARMVDWSKVGRKPFDARRELLAQSLRILNSQGEITGEAFAITSNDPAAIEGAHADYIFLLYDESKSIPDGIWDSTEGALTNAKGEALAMAVSTPGDIVGRFYEINTQRDKYQDWHVRFVALEERIKEGSVSEKWVEDRKRQWGEDSAIFKNQVLGEFAAADRDGVIPWPWVEAAMERWEEIYGDVQEITIGNHTVIGQRQLSPDTEEIVSDIGVDIGQGGENSNLTVEVIAAHPHVLQINKYPRGNADTATMETAGRVKGKLERYKSAIAYLDTIGIGVGVFHRLKEQESVKARVMPFNAGARTSQRDQTKEMSFVNKRAAMWWTMRELLDPANDTGVAIPRDDRLLGELTAVRYFQKSNSAIQIESKEEIAKRIGGSTDIADAVIMALTGGKIAKIADTQIYQVGVGYIDA